MKSYRGNLWESLDLLVKITKAERKTYSIESTPQDAGEISGPDKCLCNSISRLRSINSFDFIDKSFVLQNITLLLQQKTEDSSRKK